jgi:hypothetical protein
MTGLIRSNSYWKKHEGGQMNAVIILSPRDYGAVLFDIDAGAGEAALYTSRDHAI